MGVKVVFSGLTAAGKTTHARVLGEALDIPIYSASSYLAEVSQASGKARWKGRWSPEIDVARLNDTSIDDRVDEYMVGAVRGTTEGLFDGCFLPWLIKDPETINLWIESDLPSRVRKCIVSHEVDSPLSAAEATAVIESKDSVSAERLKAVARSSFRYDETRFHIVLDNSTLIPQATAECAAKGIATFSAVLFDVIEWSLGERRTVVKSPHVIFARRL